MLYLCGVIGPRAGIVLLGPSTDLPDASAEEPNLLYNTRKKLRPKVPPQYRFHHSIMYPYDYADFLQLHFNPDAAFDYDFDAHIAQYANVFGTEEKGCLDEHHGPLIPIILSESDVFGSPYSSSSSRSSSIANGSIKSEDLDCDLAAPTSPPSRPQVKRKERYGIYVTVQVPALINDLL